MEKQMVFPKKLSNKKEFLITVITGVIAALFFYAAYSKLIDYEKSSSQMHNQVFPSYIASILTWLIPTLEIILTIGLLFPITRIKALKASLILLIIFTLYIAVVMTGIFGRIPCSCGGILENMSYGKHIIFNLFFIAITIFGLMIQNNRSFNNLNGKEAVNQYT